MTCYGCKLKEDVERMDVDRLVAEQLALESDLADDRVRDRRLAICRRCPHLSAHTCTLCGCFVAFRASLAFKDCPEHRW